jgi:predicted lipoprotein
MTSNRSRRALRIVVVAAIVAGALAILRPWTVVPIHTTAERAFNADGYVASAWSDKVLPAAHVSAIELQTFMENGGLLRSVRLQPDVAEGARRAVFVKATATVADVDRKSRVGLARLRLPWAKDGQAAAIQIGPVVRGTALRDALEFIRFTDFVNQLEFAGVANALNSRVLTDVLGRVNVETLAGREITFVGAVATSTSGSTLEIVPVRIQVAGGAQ